MSIKSYEIRFFCLKNGKDDSFVIHCNSREEAMSYVNKWNGKKGSKFERIIFIGCYLV